MSRKKSSGAWPAMGRAPSNASVWMLTSELESDSAGSFRQERWCTNFLSAGARVRVCNIRGAMGLTSAEFATQAEFADFRRIAVTRSTPRASVREGALAKIARRVKHGLFADLYLPNLFMLAFKCLWRIARTRERIIIMSSSPPFSLAVVGAVLKAVYPQRVILAVDMRDAWAMHTSLGGNRRVKRGLERSVLRRADHVSTVSYGLKREFEAAYGINVDVLYNVATHYIGSVQDAEIDWTDLNPRIGARRYKLVYTGSTPPGFYDLTSIVSAIKQLRRAHPSQANAIQLLFVGACDEVRAEVARQGGISNDDIVFVEHVPHETAKAIQQNADALLFLAYHGEGNKGVVSTKIFEYLALGKPVLPLSLHAGSDVDRILHTYCGTSRNLHCAAEMMRALKEVADGKGERLPRLTDRTMLHHFARAYSDFTRALLDS